MASSSPPLVPRPESVEERMWRKVSSDDDGHNVKRSSRRLDIWTTLLAYLALQLFVCFILHYSKSIDQERASGSHWLRSNRVLFVLWYSLVPEA
jgi:hypothetical protein